MHHQESSCPRSGRNPLWRIVIADSTSRICCSIVACHLSFYIRWPEATHWRLSDITHAQGPLEETEGDNREKPSERERGGGNRGVDLERQTEIQRQRDRDRQTDRQNREERTIPKRARKREKRVMLRARLANRPRLMGRWVVGIRTVRGVVSLVVPNKSVPGLRRLLYQSLTQPGTELFHPL